MTDRVYEKSTSITRNQDSNTYSRTLEEVQRDFQQVDPSSINAACNEWSALAHNLGALSASIRELGAPLSDAWESSGASPRAQEHLQTAHATAQAMADQAMHMARATDYASQYASWYSTHIPGAGLVHTSSDDKAAVEHMVKLLNRYNEVIAYNLPAEVRARFVSTSHYDGFTKDGGGGGGAGSTSASGAGGGGGGPASQGSAPGHVGSTEAPRLVGTVTDSGTDKGLGDLASPGGGPGSGLPAATQPGSGPGGGAHPLDSGSALAGGGDLGGIGAGGALGGGGLGVGGSGGGAAGAGSAGGLGGAPATLGAGGLPGSGSLAGTRGAGASGSGASGSGASGSGASGSGAGAGASGSGASAHGAGTSGVDGTTNRGMMPMHGGQGQEVQDRERSTWLTEDEDVWGADNDAPPPVIGK